MESLDYWRICDELSVIQAATLLVGGDPSSDASRLESLDAEKNQLAMKRQKPRFLMRCAAAR
jgi:hypothetical protein